MRAVAIIPARFASTRFPGKPLASLLGRPMIAWVVEAARAAGRIEGVWVATDSREIAGAARAAGAEALLTSPDCPSGTDRAAEVARQVEAAVYVNVQGDEPLVDPGDIDSLVDAFDDDPPQIATLARPIVDSEELWSPDTVKVVCDRAGGALYFSRSPIPYYRDAWAGGGARAFGSPHPQGCEAPLRHLGLYAYTRDALLAFPGLPRGLLEEAECLEQLRALEAGWKIRVLAARGDAIGVDRPEDVKRVEAALRERESTKARKHDG